MPIAHRDEPDYAWVPAAPFRAHLHRLRAESGLPWSVIALAAGVPPALVQSLVLGRRGRPVRRISPAAASRLLGLDVGLLRKLPRRRVDAAPTTARVRHLLAQGCDIARLAEWCRCTPAQVRALLRGSRCSELTALLVEAACLAHEREVVRARPALRAA
jgi:hypothetical protein